MSRNISSNEAYSAFTIAFKMLKTSLDMMDDLDRAIEPNLQKELEVYKSQLNSNGVLEEISIRERYLELIAKKAKVKV